MRVKTEAKREAIVKAASEVFSESGFEGASMAEIATRVGGSKATLYGYFSSKEDLFLEVAHNMAKRHIEPIFAALAEDHDDLEQALRRFAERSLTVLCIDSSLQAGRAIIAESGRSDIGLRFYELGPKKGMEAVARFLEKHMDSGRLRRADTMVAARHLTALLDSETVTPLLFGVARKISKAALRQAVGRALETFLAGYANPTAVRKTLAEAEASA